MKKKYFVNVGRGTLHKTDYESCYNAKHPPGDAKYYDTEDEVIETEKFYTKRGRICFKNQ